MKDAIYLKGLHGIRAIAAIAVVISHTNLYLPLIGVEPKATLDIAGFGVTMFFALSGFLITYLLLLEKEKSGKVNIRHFYVRRILRIWPLYFFYLFLAMVSFYFLLPANINHDIIYYIFFIPNFLQVVGGGTSYIGHFWSLGVEEHFYAFWPWLFYKAKKPINIVAYFLVSYFLLRIGCWYLDIKGIATIPYIAVQVNRFDCMAMGGFGACLFFKQNSFFLRLCFSKITQFIAWLIIGLLIINKYHVASLIDHQIISLVTLVLIVNGIANEKRILSIENKLMTFLGKISFGIYVYHPLLILLISLGFHNMESDASIKAALFYTLVLSSTIVVSYLSYNYFEKKFLQLKTKYTSVAPSSIEPNSHNTNTLERVTI